MKKTKATIEEIRASLHEFNRLYGHYPNSMEVDFNREMFPPIRQIQRRFGGLVKIKQEMGLPVADNRKGETRTKVASEANRRGLENELKMLSYLHTKFPPVSVHRGFQVYDDSRMNIDFRIFTGPNHEGFAVDTFFPATLHSFNGCMNLKINRYLPAKISIPVYFVSMNPNITQAQIEELKQKKEMPIPDNFIFCSYEHFKTMI